MSMRTVRSANGISVSLKMLNSTTQLLKENGIIKISTTFIACMVGWCFLHGLSLVIVCLLHGNWTKQSKRSYMRMHKTKKMYRSISLYSILDCILCGGRTTEKKLLLLCDIIFILATEDFKRFENWLVASLSTNTKTKSKHINMEKKMQGRKRQRRVDGAAPCKRHTMRRLSK